MIYMGSKNKIMKEKLLQEQINKQFGFTELPDDLEKRYCDVCKKELVHKKQIFNGYTYWDCHGFNHAKNLQLHLNKLKEHNLHELAKQELLELDKKYMNELRKMGVE